MEKLSKEDYDKISKMGKAGGKAGKQLSQLIIDFYELLEKIIEEREQKNVKKGT